MEKLFTLQKNRVFYKYLYKCNIKPGPQYLPKSTTSFFLASSKLAFYQHFNCEKYFVAVKYLIVMPKYQQ